MTTAAFLLLAKTFWASNGVYITSILFATSEILANVPSIKSNSVIEFLLQIIMLGTKKK
jgi:hypothetical protein